MQNNTGTEGYTSGRKPQAMAKDTYEAVNEVVTDLKDRASEYVQEKGQQVAQVAREAGSRQLETLSDAVKRDPITSIAIAVGLGVLGGMLFRRGH